ncbi:MAG: ubiquinol-cytochrome c reductase iron-sulfur subunit [Lentilitoribacter sp.]
MSEQDNGKNDQNEPTRRDFLYLSTGMAAAVGAVGVAWPFIDQMNPDAATRAAGEPIEVNVSSLEPGGHVIVKWRGKPYFVRYLTDDEVVAADQLTAGDMKDFAPVDTRLGGPGDDAKKWVVVSANCTHLGCVPQVVDSKPEGWACACHGSVFDTTGRILRGPAAVNLPKPPYVFANETTLVIGTDQA